MNQETAELPSTTRHFNVLLSPTPRGARLARLLAAEQIRSWGLPLDPARQIVAELSANAAAHGRVPGRDFRLVLYATAGVLRIEVTDTCPEHLPRPQHPDALSESGRGLLLVEALAHRWGVAEGPYPRKTVWAELMERKNPTKPHQARPHRSRPASLPRVNIIESAGLPAPRLPYAQRQQATATRRSKTDETNETTQKTRRPPPGLASHMARA